MSRDRQWQESVSRDASSAPSVASSHNGRCARIRAAYAIARCNTSKSVRVGAAEACKQSRKKQRTYRYKDVELAMWSHLKIGFKNSRTETLRVHFAWIAEERKLVVGWCGEHRHLVG